MGKSACLWLLDSVHRVLVFRQSSIVRSAVIWFFEKEVLAATKQLGK
jgi:hypothetical protein